MPKMTKRLFTFLAAALVCTAAFALYQEPTVDPDYEEVEIIYTPSATIVVEDGVTPNISPFSGNAMTNMQNSRVIRPGDKSQKAKKTRKPKTEYQKLSFAWGADAGASIDLTGSDMSAIDFNAGFGLKRGWLNFLGLGVGANISVSNSSRSYPMFLEFRTNFVDRPTLVFFDLRGGIAYNELENNHNQFGIYGNTGIGFNLARSNNFTSYLSLSYTFKQRKAVEDAELTRDFKDLHMATFRIGITF